MENKRLDQIIYVYQLSFWYIFFGLSFSTVCSQDKQTHTGQNTPVITYANYLRVMLSYG